MLAEIEELKKMCNELDVQLEEYKQQDGKTEVSVLTHSPLTFGLGFYSCPD